MKRALTKAFQLYAKQRYDLPPGSLIPAVIVPYENLEIEFKKDLQHEQELKNISQKILKHNQQFLSYGLTYIQDVLDEKEETNLIDHTLGYIQEFGLRVEEEHLIQLSDRTLNPEHPSIQKLKQNLVDHAKLKPSNVTMTPNFNYYPFAGTRLHAHHDNLFLSGPISVTTIGYSGSARPITFTHWVTGLSFTIYVEPRSMYIMNGFIRYDFTHGGTANIPQDDNEIQIQSIFQRCRGQRLSYVCGSYTNVEIRKHMLQVYGDSDQRQVIEYQIKKKLSLMEYLDYILFLNRNMPDFEILSTAVNDTKNFYQKSTA